MQERPGNKPIVDWVDLAVFVASAWIAIAFASSLFFRIHWLTSGDFDYPGAMYYHGLMIPTLIVLYLLAIKIVPAHAMSTRMYGVGAILAVLLVGFGSVFNGKEGISAAGIMQIVGMVMTDVLGILLLVALLLAYRERRKTNVAFWVLFFSIAAVITAASLGHLAGWGIDVGIRLFPGVPTLLSAAGMAPEQFQEGLVSSHSHLIVAALLCGLVALTAIHIGYERFLGWGRRMSRVGLWMMLVALLAATVVYGVSAAAGWEPPTVLTSGLNGENGVPLDDVVLIFGEIGFLVLTVGLIAASGRGDAHAASSSKTPVRGAIFLNWILGFAGAALFGLYIEFNETFYGGGNPPAAGAANDQAFIRAHLLYPFLLFPIILALLLAVECGGRRAAASRTWPRVFAWTAIFGMSLGLIGEYLWVATLDKEIALAGMIALGAAIIAGVVSLWPHDLAEALGRRKHPTTPKGEVI